MPHTVHYERRERIALVLIDNPPVNALGAAVRAELDSALSRALADSEVAAVVLTGQGTTFIGGADIRELGQSLPGPTLSEVLARLEASPKPIVAAINGLALGGGLEVALCCDHRIASPQARLGLPEVKLGLLPGAGGTQRLPRLVALPMAIEMMATGEPISAGDALAAGLVDRVLDGDVVGGAVAFAEELLSGTTGGPALRKVRDLPVRLDPEREPADVLASGRAMAEKRRRGQTAAARILRCVEAALTAPSFDEGLRVERELFGECMADPQRDALMHVFFAERRAARIPDVTPDTPRHPVRLAAVVGAGTMGRGVAMCFADAGIPVLLTDLNDDRIDEALDHIRRTYASSVRRGRLQASEVAVRMDRIDTALDLESLDDVDLVVECVFEDPALKRELFERLAKSTRQHCVLASNTSTLDIDAIAGSTSRPGSVVGMHFFSPAQVMRLVEVVRGPRTDLPTLATTVDVARTLGKIPVVAGSCDGFIGNRMLAGYKREAEFLLEEGALPHQVDAALVAFGMPMGPFAVADLGGLDVGWRIRRHRGPTPGVRRSRIADRLCEMGRFGQKTGAGWYRYDEGGRDPLADPVVEDVIAAESRALGMPHRSIEAEEIVERCIYPLIREGACILEDGIALRPGDIDVVYVYGYGFPAWRGGPMYYADRLGLDHVRDRLAHYHAHHHDFFRPAPLLDRLVAEHRTFASLEAH